MMVVVVVVVVKVVMEVNLGMVVNVVVLVVAAAVVARRRWWWRWRRGGGGDGGEDSSAGATAAPAKAAATAEHLVEHVVAGPKVASVGPALLAPDDPEPRAQSGQGRARELDALGSSPLGHRRRAVVLRPVGKLEPLREARGQARVHLTRPRQEDAAYAPSSSDSSSM